MSEPFAKVPVYIRVSLLLIGICALGFILYIGQSIILPLIYAFILAALLDPFVGLLEKIRIPRLLAITITVILAVGVAFGIVYFISSQIATFSSSLPEFKVKGGNILNEAEGWVAQTFHTSVSKVHEHVTQMAKALQDGTLLGSTIAIISGLVASLVLIPVYIFMILYYKHLFFGFIIKAFPKENHQMVGEVMLKSNEMLQSYLIGLMLEAVIVAILNSAGLLILGIKYAILLGIVGALLNIIPFIGGIIAIALAMLVAMVTADFTSAVLVLGVFLAIQFVDNNYLVPRIVASRVRLNALISIVAVLVTGALWGIAGMFLAIPLTAALKIIFDRIEPLQPWGLLLGDDIPLYNGFVRLFSKHKSKKTA